MGQSEMDKFMSSKSGISLSVVSHGQLTLVQNLLEDLQRYCMGEALSIEVILTLNLPEQVSFDLGRFSFPVRVITNILPKGFGANHNEAFKLATGRLFCVINPDIRLMENPFPLLVAHLLKSTGVIAPLVRNTQGRIEDSARLFPTPWHILLKAIRHKRVPDYVIGHECLQPDWVGGMFMLFQRNAFSSMHGFDERYFLYYEDVDLCARMKLRNFTVVLCPQVSVIHDARRSSHRSVRYAMWHLRSMIRFFLSKPFRSIIISRWASET